MTIKEFEEEIVNDCEKKRHFARQGFYLKKEQLKSSPFELLDKINKLGVDNRVIYADLNEYSCFSEFIKSILNKIFDDPKFSEENTLVTREDYEHEDSEGELCYQLNCLLKEDFKMEGIHTLIIIDNYENSKNIWSPGNYGWMRGLLCDCQLLSIVVYSDERVSDVSDEPRGSSPFYNIFDIEILE